MASLRVRHLVLPHAAPCRLGTWQETFVSSAILMCLQACLDLGPAIIYNVPARTAQDIPDDVIADLAAHSNFLGVKECTGNQRIQVPKP